MITEEHESVLQEYYTTGAAYQQLQLENAIKYYQKGHDRLIPNAMLTEALRIRRDQEWGLMACPVEPGSMSMRDNEFLNAVAKVCSKQRRMYRPTFFYSWLVEHDINPLRERYVLSPQDSRELAHCPNLAQAENWTDEELLTWLGRYEYITSIADKDLRRCVDEIFGIESIAEVSANGIEPTNIEEQPTYTAIANDNGQEDPKKYNARDASIAFYLLLEGMTPGVTMNMNIDATARLLARIHGGSVDNLDGHLTELRTGAMTLDHVRLGHIRAAFEETKIRISYDVLDRIDDKTIDVQATPPEQNAGALKGPTFAAMLASLQAARKMPEHPEQSYFDQALSTD